MAFVVVEIQKDKNGVISNIATNKETEAAAHSCYHSILAAAATSNLPVHSAAILSEEGFLLERYCYKHE